MSLMNTLKLNIKGSWKILLSKSISCLILARVTQGPEGGSMLSGIAHSWDVELEILSGMKGEGVGGQ